MGDSDREAMPAIAGFNLSLGPNHLPGFCLSRTRRHFVARMDILRVGPGDVFAVSTGERYGKQLKLNCAGISLNAQLQKEFVQILNKDVFGAGDSVEAFDYNLDTRRLAITSHYGHVSLYSLFDGELSLIWSKALPDCIPRAVQFQRGFNRVIVFALETGKL